MNPANIGRDWDELESENILSIAKVWDGHERVDKEPYISLGDENCWQLRKLLEDYLNDFYNQCHGEYTENVVNLLRKYSDKIDTALFIYQRSKKRS